MLASAVERHGPGSASPGASSANVSSEGAPEGEYVTAMVEHMEKNEGREEFFAARHDSGVEVSAHYYQRRAFWSEAGVIQCA